MFQFTPLPSLALCIHARITAHYCSWVPSFGNLRIIGYLLLPVAYRSLSRPSSAPSAKASALCSYSLDQKCPTCFFTFLLCCSSSPAVLTYLSTLRSSECRAPCTKVKTLRRFFIAIPSVRYGLLIKTKVNQLLWIGFLLISGFSVEIVITLSSFLEKLT